MSKDKKVPTEEEIEILSAHALDNHGPVEFDRIEDHGDCIFFYNGDVLAMIVPMSLEEFSKFIEGRYDA